MRECALLKHQHARTVSHGGTANSLVFEILDYCPALAFDVFRADPHLIRNGRFVLPIRAESGIESDFQLRDSTCSRSGGGMRLLALDNTSHVSFRHQCAVLWMMALRLNFPKFLGAAPAPLTLVRAVRAPRAQRCARAHRASRAESSLAKPS